MSTAVEVKDAIKVKLAASTDLMTTYGVKKIVEGFQSVTADSEFPFIAIEVLNEREEHNDVNQNITCFVTFLIFGVMSISDESTQMTLTLTFSNLIKKALSQDFTIGGTSDGLNFGEVQHSYEYYPYRSLVIPIEVEFRQIFATRA